MKKPAPFKQSVVTRALKAVNSAGLPVSRLEIEPDGKLSIMIGAAQHIEAAEVASIESALGKLENGQGKNPVLRRSQR